MIGRILVPLDGSAQAEVVLPYAKELAKRLNARITFLQVVESGITEGTRDELSKAAVEEMEKRAEREVKVANDYLLGLASDWVDEGIDATWQVAHEAWLPRGTPAVKIVELAHSLWADLIAMSTHGRSGLGRVFFGSVADEVLREADTPVLLIRAGHKGEKTLRASE
jgi:nucleotide-binding universal stress UspA family protein